MPDTFTPFTLPFPEWWNRDIVCFKKHGFWREKKIFQFSSPPHFDICRKGEISEKSGWRKESRGDEKYFSGLTLKIVVTDSHALVHQELCITTCKQALGIPVVLVYALNSTDATVQSDISKDYIKCFLINVSFVFCPFHVKFWVKWQLGSQYFSSLSFPGLLFYLLCSSHVCFSMLYWNISNATFRTWSLGKC